MPRKHFFPYSVSGLKVILYFSPHKIILRRIFTRWRKQNFCVNFRSYRKIHPLYSPLIRGKKIVLLRFGSAQVLALHRKASKWAPHKAIVWFINDTIWSYIDTLASELRTFVNNLYRKNFYFLCCAPLIIQFFCVA